MTISSLQALRLVPVAGAPMELELLNSTVFERHLPLRDVAESAADLLNRCALSGSASIVQATQVLTRPNLPSCWALRIALPQLPEEDPDQVADFLIAALKPHCPYTTDSILHQNQQEGSVAGHTLTIQSDTVRRKPGPVLLAGLKKRNRLTSPEGFNVNETTGEVTITGQKIGTDKSGKPMIAQTVEGICYMLRVFPLGFESLDAS